MSDAQTAGTQKAPITAETVSAVLALIETGTPENTACRQIGIPRSSFRWAAYKFAAADTYARAGVALAYDQVEKLEQTLERMHAGEIEPAAARVDVEARKWFASHFLPSMFGDKLDLHATTNATVTHLVDSTDIAALDNDQREALKEIANALLSQRTAGKAISQWEDVDHEAIEGELSNKAG